MKRSSITKIAFVFFILFNACNTQAGWLENNWNAMVGTSTTAPDMMQKQGSGAFYGGGFSYSTGGTVTTSISPFNIQMPSISAGCGGIDIVSGAFDYNIEDLINFLKSLVSIAPGYAFQLAMQIFCPSCLDILNTLQEITGMINGLQMDSCAVMQGLTDMASNAANKAVQQNIDEGGFFSYRKSMETFNKDVKKGFNKFFDEITKKIGCLSNPAGCNSIDFLKGKKSLLEGVFETLEKNTSDASLKTYFTGDYPQLFKSLIGDIKFIEINSDSEKDYNMKLSHIKPIHAGSETIIINKLINGTEDALPLKGTTNNYPQKVDIFVAPLSDNDKYTRTASFSTFNSIAYNTIESAKAKYQILDRSKDLTPEELSFFATLKTPVLKTLNVIFVNDEMPQSFLEELKPLAGVQLNYEIMMIVAKNMQLVINQYEDEMNATDLYKDDMKAAVKEIRANMAKLQQISYQKYITQYTAFEERIKNLDKDGIFNQMKNTRAAFLARHPVAGSAVFAGGIAK